MNNDTPAKFLRSLELFHNDGIAEWKECIFTDNLNDFAKKSQISSGTLHKNLTRILHDVFHLGGIELKTFVMKKVYSRISSLAEAANSNGNNGVFNGCPLELEDKLGEMSFSYATRISAIFDESSLISEKEYREIMSRFCLLLSSDDKDCCIQKLENLFPMILFCKWRKKCSDSNGIVIITPVLGENKTIINLLERKVNLSGPYPSNIWRPDSAENLSPSHVACKKSNCNKFHSVCLQSLVQQHLARCRSKAGGKVSVKSYAEYELLESNKHLMEYPDEDLALTYVTLSLTCGKVEKILQVDKQHVKEIKMNITPAPGDMRSSAFSLFKAVQILEGFFCAFGDAGEVKWTSVDDLPTTNEQESSVKKEKLTIVEQIREVIGSYNQEWILLNRARKQAKAIEAPNNNDTTNEDQATKQMIFPREELDFTERVWEVLQYVGSCQQLIESFQIIVKEVSECRATQFWLHNNNSTTLAKLIKESYTGKVSTKIEMGSSECIQLLIELGLDKLSRDYSNFFITSRLASMSRLQSYLENNSKSDEGRVENLKKRFVNLKKLHHIVELIVQCKCFFNLSDERTSLVTKMALHDYESEDLDFRKTFTFSIDYAEVECLIENRLPTVWRMTLSSEDDFMKTSTDHCWMLEYPFHGIISEPNKDLDALNTPATCRISTSSMAFDVAVKYHIATKSETIF
uniref:protein zwilch homolog n=1 Tax=Styela clava TaxID=7725 RepID=UPI0019393355|nr:protein zwilch homolog [Styela clava]